MNKEYLEALKTIKIKCHPNSNPNPLIDSALDTIEQALRRLESIENSKPSKALEDLDKMANQVFQVDDEFELYYDKVKQALQRLKAIHHYSVIVYYDSTKIWEKEEYKKRSTAIRSFEEFIELTDIDMGFVEKIELIGFDEDGTEHLMDTWHNPLDQN